MLGGMKEYHKVALTKLRVALAQELVPDELLEHLLADGVLTQIMKENVESNNRRFKQNTVLLDLLPSRGPHAFSVFCAALRNTGQKHLAQQLEAIVKNMDPEGDQLQCHGLDNFLTMLRTVDTENIKISGDRLETQFPLSVQETIPRGRPFSLECSEMSIDDGDGPVGVSHTSVGFYLSHHKQAYKMSTFPRGLALIISNIQFSDPELGQRYGGEVDEAALKHLFSNFNYSVIFRSDLTAKKMKSELIRFSSLPDHCHLDSAIVAILSHGVDSAIYGTDSQLVKLQDIFTIMDNAHCPQLQNKPKMFFIQACRGVDADRGVDQRDGRDQAASPSCEQSDAGRENGNVRLPTQSDMICAYACLKGTVSLRNTKRGSWFIQDLANVFSKHAKDTHVADMLVKVNACIKKREGHAPGTEFDRCKEMSEYCSTLCKDLYLFPGTPPRSHQLAST